MKTLVGVGATLLFLFCAWTYGADTPKEKDRDGRFVAYDNNTVLDTQTNLMWAATDNGTALSWPDAKSFCEQFRGGGYSDWRLPTASELQGLYDAAKSYKISTAPNDSRVGGPYDVSEVHLTKLIRLTGSSAWSSNANDSTFSALIFSFHYGGKAVGRPQYKTFIDADGRALPVRIASLLPAQTPAALDAGQQGHSNATETFEELSQKDIPVTFRAAAKSIQFVNGKPVMSDATVVKFAVSNTDIELVSDKIVVEGENTVVNTKRYGKVRVVFGGDFSATIWVTPSQKAELLKLAK